MADPGPARPPVTLRGAPEPCPAPASDDPGAPERTGRAVVPVLVLLAALVLVFLLAGVVGVQAPTAPAPPTEASGAASGALPDAWLELRADSVSLSRGGVLVVPVVLHNRGGELRLRSVEAYAVPVRSDTATTAPATVGPGDSRRFVVLLEPDCRFVTPTSGLAFRSGLLVVVEDRAGVRRSLGLDLGDASVRSVVTALCRRP